MIFSLCNNDITKKKYIEENFDVIDFVEWSSFKKFDNFQDSEIQKRYQDANK